MEYTFIACEQGNYQKNRLLMSILRIEARLLHTTKQEQETGTFQMLVRPLEFHI